MISVFCKISVSAGNTLVAVLETDGSGTEVYYHHGDHLGGANIVTNDTGALVQEIDYHPFGSVRANNQSASYDSTQKFTGHELDDATGLYYAQARYYDPNVGRFVSQDPLQVRPQELMKKFGGQPQALNYYSYVVNNPLILVDPEGEDANVTINEKEQTITISARIFIYGEDATDDLAQRMQQNIMNEWDKGWSYTDDSTGVSYDVIFNITVESVWLGYDRYSTDANTIKVEGNDRSYVDNDGDSGEWRSTTPDPSPHEFGHLIGLDDQYSDSGGANKGWQGNIMAEPAMQGKVEQRNIDRTVKPFVDKHNDRWFPNINNVTRHHIAPNGNYN